MTPARLLLYVGAAMKLLFPFLLFSFWTVGVLAADSLGDASFVVHILGYVRKDYSGAVENGKIKNNSEYKEQIEFIESAIASAKDSSKLKSEEAVLTGLESLRRGILKKVSAEKVASDALALETRIIQVAGLEVAPLRWPDRAHGKKLYKESCTQCHGVNGHGDGPMGKRLDPPAADFFAEGMSESTPYQLFNTIRLGVPGTGMAAFSELSDKEVWDLAFYVVSLRHEAAPIATGTLPRFSLAEVANSTDRDLLKKFPGSSEEKIRQLGHLRLHSLPSEGGANTISIAREKIEEALAALQRGDNASAKQAAVVAYLEGVEPIEPRLRAKNPELTVEIEEKMANLRAAIDAGLTQGAVEKRAEEVRDALAQVEAVLSKPDFTPAFSFWVAMGIFTREAFEAVLVIITLLGVIRSIGSRKAALYVHGGWMLALGLGLIAWFFSGWILQISGAQRELLEGSISLLAVVVLLYFGFWLHRKTEIGRWRAFLGDMVKSAVEGKNLYALGAVSFMAVFREAFETVLFLRALVLEAGPAHYFAVGGGVLLAFIGVVILSTILVRYSVKLPLRQLFSVSTVILLLLSFILVGKGVHSFQEVGLLGITLFPIHLRMEILGIFPTYESWIPQSILIVACFGVWLYGKVKDLPSSPASASKSSH